jgi:hypothetical protein
MVKPFAFYKRITANKTISKSKIPSNFEGFMSS